MRWLIVAARRAWRVCARTSRVGVNPTASEMRRRLQWVGALLVGVSTGQAGAGELTLYVSTDGRDTWSGQLAAPSLDRADGPLASLQGARDRLRTIRGAVGNPGPVRVLVRGGVYQVSGPLELDSQDSGASGAPVWFEAFQSETPVISGGRTVGGWRVAGAHWEATLPPDFPARGPRNNVSFGALWVGESRRIRSRTPNAGYLHTLNSIEQDLQGFRYFPGDLRPSWRYDPATGAGAVVTVLHEWEASLHCIAAVDQASDTVLFTAPVSRPAQRFVPSERYWIENVPDALDSPGEWFLDVPTRTIRYVPMPGERVDGFEATVPVAEQLLVLRGTQEHPVDHVRFTGLTFEHTDWQAGPQGVEDGQAAVSMGAAVTATWAQSVTLERCRIVHTGQYGAWFRAGSRSCVLRQCELADLGGGGVKIGEASYPDPSQMTMTIGNAIDNCFIHDGGKIRPSAVGVWIGKSSYNTLSRSEICDFDYSGVSVGWDWTTGESHAHHNTVTRNRIHHIGRAVLSDLGGVYTLGSSFGTEVSYNLIYAVLGRRKSHGIYADEGSEGIAFHHNIVCNVLSGAAHIHWGRGLSFDNNILAYAGGAAMDIDGHAQHDTQATFSRNIALSNNGGFLGPDVRRWDGDPGVHATLLSNLYWDVTGRPVGIGCRTLSQWEAAGRERGSVAADPQVRNAAALDFSMLPGPGTASIGFEPIDTSEIGLYGPAEWVRVPGEIQRLDDALPDPWPRLRATFDGLRPGLRAPGAVTGGEAPGAGAWARVAERSGGGGESLFVQDAPGLPVQDAPTVVWFPGIHAGIVTDRFSVYLHRPATENNHVLLSHTWQDTLSSGTQTGPRLFIDAAGTIKVPGHRLGRAPFERWFTITIESSVGLGSTGAYSVRIDAPGVSGQTFEFQGAPMCGLLWYGFGAPANEPVAYEIDSIDVRSH